MFRQPPRGTERLRRERPSATEMRVIAELFPSRREEPIELGPNSKGLDLLRALRLAPDAHILVRRDIPIAVDEDLVDGDRIRVVTVVSGGASA